MLQKRAKVSISVMTTETTISIGGLLIAPRAVSGASASRLLCAGCGVRRAPEEVSADLPGMWESAGQSRLWEPAGREGRLVGLRWDTFTTLDTLLPPALPPGVSSCVLVPSTILLFPVAEHPHHVLIWGRQSSDRVPGHELLCVFVGGSLHGGLLTPCLAVV